MLSSCIGIKTTISLEENGSGTITISYKISKMVTQLGQSEENEIFIPLAMTRENFERSLSDIPGIKLLDIDQQEDEDNIFINARIQFQKVEDLSKIDSFKDWPATFTLNNGDKIFTQIIVPDASQEISKETLDIIKTIFVDYELIYTINTPSEIQEHNLGELTDDKRSLDFKLSIPELLTEKNRITLRVQW